MGFYKKKPVIVEAEQWDGTLGSAEKIYKFCKNSKMTKTSHGPVIIIHTLEGDMQASAGDYIIKGIAGEFYPCKQDIFEESYEMVT